MKRNQYFVVILAVSLVQICLANPLPPAELVRVSAYPPEIEIAFNDFPDSLDISGYNIFTSHGIATIDSGTYIYYDENWPGFIVLDSSNTSGFIINQERDSVYTDIEVYGEPVMYGFCYFGIWGRIPPPIKGHSLIVKPYSTYHNWDYRSYGLTFDFSNWDPGFTDVILSEINSHCTWSNDCNFIELYNTSDQDINLSGYKIVCDTIYDLPDNVIIPANGFCVIDEVDFPTGFDMDPGFDNIYLINPDPLWIFDGNRLVDQVGWSSDHAENVSFMRFPDGDVDSTINMRDFMGFNDTSSYTFEDGVPTRGAPNRHESPGFVVIGARADSIDDATARIHWTDPIWDDTFTASMLVKSHGGYVLSPEEGEIIYTGNNQEFTEELIIPEMPYYFTVFARDHGGLYSTPTGESQAFIQFGGVGIEQENLPEYISVLSSYPNPFNAQTTISFSLEQQSPVNISIYDITGRLVEVLISNTFEAGNHSLSWDAGGQPSGIYFARLLARDDVSTSRMVLLK